MLSGFLGKKIGMTQIYTDDGRLLPITLIQAGPCSVMQIKTIENDGYSSIKLGFDDKKKEKCNKTRNWKCGKGFAGAEKVRKGSEARCWCGY